MHETDFITLLARMTPWRQRDVEARWRAMRRDAVLPADDPDPQSPEIGPERAGYLLIALAAPDTVAETNGAIAAYAAMPARGEPFAGQPSFGEALADILGNAALAELIDDVVVCRTWPTARIEYTLEAGQAGVAHYADVEDHRTPGVRVEAGLSGSLFRRLAAELETPAVRAGG